MYLISIYFDEKTTKRIQGYIDNIAKKTGNTFMTNGNVLPHITVGKKLSTEEMKIAFNVMQNQFGAFEGKVTKIGLAKTNPYYDIITYEL